MAKTPENRSGGVNIGPGTTVLGEVVGRDKIGGPRRGLDADLELMYVEEDLAGKIGKQLAKMVVEKYRKITLEDFYMEDEAKLAETLGVDIATAETIQKAVIELISGQ